VAAAVEQIQVVILLEQVALAVVVMEALPERALTPQQTLVAVVAVEMKLVLAMAAMAAQALLSYPYLQHNTQELLLEAQQ
jgi:hypothetical protein